MLRFLLSALLLMEMESRRYYSKIVRKMRVVVDRSRCRCCCCFECWHDGIGTEGSEWKGEYIHLPVCLPNDLPRDEWNVCDMGSSLLPGARMGYYDCFTGEERREMCRLRDGVTSGSWTCRSCPWVGLLTSPLSSRLQLLIASSCHLLLFVSGEGG